MRQFRFGTFCAAAMVGLGLSAGMSRADEKEVPLDKVPKAVMAAFKAKFPEVTINKAIEEVEDGKTTYELESTRPGGLSLDAVLKPDGTIVAVEKQIKPSELPAAVAPAVAAKFPKSEITKAEAVDSAGKVSYEVVVKKADGKSATLIFDKDGKFVEEEK